MCVEVYVNPFKYSCEKSDSLISFDKKITRTAKIGVKQPWPFFFSN